MPDYLDRFSKTFTDEVAATIGRIDELIGEAHWLSVGNYKESVIRRQLVDLLPGRYAVGTGFVLSPGEESPIRSKQIDVLIWDCHNYAPIFRDGSFVIIPPQALRVAIEVKSTLTGTVLREALENLDSLTPFINILMTNHNADPEARSGFQRYVVAAGTNLSFPDDVFRHLHRYYVQCVYDRDDPTEQHIQLTALERLDLTKETGLWGLTPWISGVAALGSGMVRAARFAEKVGYFVSNDVKLDKQDQTIGMIRQSIELFLTTDVIRHGQRDYLLTGREKGGIVMPMPYTTELPDKTPTKLFDLQAEPLTWTLEDAKAAKAKRDARKKKQEEAVGPDTADVG